MHSVLITAPSFAAPGLARLRAAGCRIFFAKDQAECDAVMARERLDAVISRTVAISGEAIRACPSLKVISRHGTGYNNVDVATATALGIPVFCTVGANAQSVAELTIGLAIAVARSLPLHDRTLREGGWSRSQTGMQLSGRTMGIIGMGHIGQKVARLASALGMKTVAFDPYVRSANIEMAANLTELLRRADVLSLHCPLTNETKGMIGARELATLPAGAIVLNMSRGGIADEMALADAVAARHIFGAGIDVFETDPIPADHPFNRLDHVIMTPHIGASTREALDNVAVMSVDNAVNFLTGAPFDSKLCVNPATLKARTTVSA